MPKSLRSGAKTLNPNFTPFSRTQGEGNLSWGERAALDMQTFDPKEWTFVALLGGADTMSFRLRVAQSHLRSDMLPSYWSEIILVHMTTASVKRAKAVHVPLLQPAGHGFPPLQNGVVEAPLAAFDDPVQYPNIALIALPVAQEKILAQVKRFQHSRSTLDALEHALRWLAFSWGVAHTGNPLFENYGIPSACMLETVLAAESFSLTPGLESRASCPEAVWSAALHWHEFFEKTVHKVPYGRFTLDHRYPIISPADHRSKEKKAGPAVKKSPAKRPPGRQ